MKTSCFFGGFGAVFKFALLVILILAFLTPCHLSARITTISSLPYTASQSGNAYSETLVVAGTRLNSATNGINFTGHDIVLRLVSDTIQFGTGNGDALAGLTFSSTAHHIRVEGGWVIHGASSDIEPNSVNCVKFTGGPHDILIRGTNMKATGDNGKCIDSYGNGTGIYNIELDGGHYWNYCRRYASRCNYDGAVIRFESGSPSGSYQVRIHGIKIWTGPGQGVVGLGRQSSLGRYQIYACTISTDHRNELYPNDDGNVCHNSANAYDIHLRFVGAGTAIYDNVLRSGATYGGSRGLMVENAVGTSSNNVQIYGNDSNTHEGPNVHYGEDFQNFGLRIRPIDGGQVQYVHVHDNSFIIVGDSADATRDYGSHPIAGCYSNDIGSNRNVIVERNLFKAYGVSLGGVNSKAFMFDGVDADSTFVFRHNRLESDKLIFKYGDYNFGATNTMLNNDTLNYVQPTQIGVATYYLGHSGNPWDCTDNSVRDMVYEGGTSDTNIVFSSGGTLDLKLRRTLSVQVMGRNNLPVTGATVTATNHYNRTVLSGTTDSHGYVRGPVAYWFESRTQTDSTAFNNFTITASKNSDNNSMTFTVSRSSPPAVIILNNTDGDGQEGDDITPPAAIQDLGLIAPHFQPLNSCCPIVDIESLRING